MMRIRTRRRPIERDYAAAKDAEGGIKKKDNFERMKGPKHETKRNFLY